MIFYDSIIMLGLVFGSMGKFLNIARPNAYIAIAEGNNG
jgi:hypothetical protein